MENDLAHKMGCLLVFVVVIAFFGGLLAGSREHDRIIGEMRRTMIEKKVGHWTIDPATGERKFEIGRVAKEE